MADSNDYNYAGQLRYKDLRSLDEDFNPHQEPSVIVRRHVVLLSLEPIRAVISSTHLVLIVPLGADMFLETLDKYLHNAFYKNTEAKELPSDEGDGNQCNNTDNDDKEIKGINDKEIPTDSQQNGNQPDKKCPNSLINPLKEIKKSKELEELQSMPYELRAYEAILNTVVDEEMAQYKVVKQKANVIICKFKDVSMVPVLHQEAMRKLKNEVSECISRLESLRRWLDELFDDDEKMALMSLTKLRKKPSLYTFPLQNEILLTHEEIEMIFDSRYRDFNTLISKLNLLKQKLTSAQEMVSMKLDTTRNELLKTNMILSIIALYLTFGGFVAGIFGMNLDNTVHLQNTPHVFITVTLVTTGVIIVGIILTIAFFIMNDILPR